MEMKLVLNDKTYNKPEMIQQKAAYRQRVDQIEGVFRALMHGVRLRIYHSEDNLTIEPYMDAKYLQHPDWCEIRDWCDFPQKTDGDLVHDPEFERVDNMIETMCKAFYIGLYGTQYENNK